MNKIFPSILLICALAFAQEILTSVAVLPSDGTALTQDEFEVLTENVREAALKVLPASEFIVLDRDVIIKRLGGRENYVKECEESCIVDLGKKAAVDYVARADVRKVSGKLHLSVNLYKVSTGGAISVLNNDGEKSVDKLLAVVKEKVPTEVFGKIPGSLIRSKNSSPIVAGGIRDLERRGGFELDGKRRYLVNLSSDPAGAVLSFNGLPIAKCTKTPCNVELPEGNVRIIANLEQYEIADTIVYINQNKQSVKIELEPNFGVLEIKPAYYDGIGKNKNWNLTINGRTYSSLKPRLSPGEYNVSLSHECYEDKNLTVGINKGGYEIYDMSNKIELKKGGLDLSAELDEKPVSEPVYVNGKQVGETPFNDAVPVCADIGIGSDKDKVDVKLVYNQTVSHKHQMGHFDPSAWTLSFYGTGVTYSLPNGEERYINSINAVLGLELIDDVSLFGLGFFMGLGNGPAEIFEYIFGLELKKIYWISERRLAMPISLGVALRIQSDYMGNREVAKFIDNQDFFYEPESYLDENRIITAYRFDVIPAIDLQYFITKSFSVYVGYMYRISNNPEWGFTYNGDDFKVPEKYVPFTSTRESTLGGIPGMLRFGLKYNGRYSPRYIVDNSTESNNTKDSSPHNSTQTEKNQNLNTTSLLHFHNSTKTEKNQKYEAVCKDGTYDYYDTPEGFSQTCSEHGGVERWLK